MRYHEILPETLDIPTLNPGQTRPAFLSVRPEDQNKALDLMSQITNLNQELKNLSSLKDKFYAEKREWLDNHNFKTNSDTVKQFNKKIDYVLVAHKKTGEKIDLLNQNYTELVQGGADLRSATLRAYEHLKKHCSDFLNKSSQAQKLLYRGLKTYPYSFRDFSFIGRSWDERFTKDTAWDTHRKVSAAMRENGFTATRENSIMCTSSYWAAKQYGEVYMIFPINGFSFTWSRTHADMFSDLFERYPRRGNWNGLINAFDNSYNEVDEQQKRSIESNFIKNELELDRTDFHAALLSGHEIYIHGQYYALDMSIFQDLNDLLRIYSWD